jgi:hypothetical protein
MFYTNMVYTDGTIGVDLGGRRIIKKYELITTEDAGIEFSRGPGVVITSPPYYAESETEYTLTWSPMGTENVDYFEVYVDGGLRVTTDQLSTTITVSSPDSYHIEVVLYTTELDTYSDEIYLEAVKPIVQGLYQGAYLLYKFWVLGDTGYDTYSHMTYKAELAEEIAPYLWQVDLTIMYFENEDDTTPSETSSTSAELDALHLTGGGYTGAFFWTNAHLLSLGDI